MSLGRLSARTFFFWGVTLTAVIAELIVTLFMIRHFPQKDPLVLMPLFALTMAVFIIWVSYLRLQRGLSTVTQHVDRKLLERLQMAADTIGVFANSAIIMGIIAMSHR